MKGVFVLNGFTYQPEHCGNKLETFEWDNFWIEQANDKKTDRIFYIGDSISCGIRRHATELSKGKLLFDNFGTSKALDNPFFQTSVELYSSETANAKAILFNNGLHGWHLNDREYSEYYQRMLDFLIEKFPQISINLVFTTAVEDRAQCDRVIARNEVVKSIAVKYDLPIIDLFEPSVKFRKLQSPDGIHFSEEGYEILAGVIVNFLKGKL